MYDMNLQNTIKSLLSVYSMNDILRVLQSFINDEKGYIENLDDLNSPGVVVYNVEQRLDDLIDYCDEESFTPNRGEWCKIIIECQHKLDEQNKLYLENAEKEQFEKLKKKYG